MTTEQMDALGGVLGAAEYVATLEAPTPDPAVVVVRSDRAEVWDQVERLQHRGVPILALSTNDDVTKVGWVSRG